MLPWVAAHTPARALCALWVLFSNSWRAMVIGMAVLGLVGVAVQMVLAMASSTPALQALVGAALVVDLAATSLALDRARWWTLWGIAPALLACLSCYKPNRHPKSTVKLAKAAFVGTLAYCCLAAVHIFDVKASWASNLVPVPIGLLVGATLDNQICAVAAQVLLPAAMYNEVKARGVHSERVFPNDWAGRVWVKRACAIGIAVVVLLAFKETREILEVAKGVLAQR